MAGIANFGGKQAPPFGAKKKPSKAAAKAAHEASGKKWTPALDAAWDKAHGVKEGSPADKKLDKKRGVKDMSRPAERFALDLASGSFKTDIDLGKDGSKWSHGYIPLNAVAVAIKEHHSTGGGGTISHHGDKGTATVKKVGDKFTVTHMRTHPTTGTMKMQPVKKFSTEAAAHEHAWKAVGGSTRLTSTKDGVVKDLPKTGVEAFTSRGFNGDDKPGAPEGYDEVRTDAWGNKYAVKKLSNGLEEHRAQDGSGGIINTRVKKGTKSPWIGYTGPNPARAWK